MKIPYIKKEIKGKDWWWVAGIGIVSTAIPGFLIATGTGTIVWNKYIKPQFKKDKTETETNNETDTEKTEENKNNTNQNQK